MKMKFISVHFQSEAFGYRSALLTWKNNNSYKNKKVCFLSCMLMLISLFSCEKGSIFMPGLTECKIGYVSVCQNMRNTKIAGN